jgi:hypothetical protein
MGSIIPRGYPRMPKPRKPKLKRPSYRSAVNWIALNADAAALHDVTKFVRLVAHLFGASEERVYGDVTQRRRQR